MSKKEILTQVVKVRLSDREHSEVKEAAKSEQRKVSDYIRMSLRKATLLTLAGRRKATR